MRLKEQLLKTCDSINKIAARRQRKLLLPFPETIIQPSRSRGRDPHESAETFVQVVAMPQVRFKPTGMRLVGRSLDEDGRGGRDLSNHLMVTDIRCGIASQFYATGPLPARVFAAENPHSLRSYYDELEAGISFTLGLKNHGPEPLLLRGAAIGLVDRNSADILMLAHALRSLANQVPADLEVVRPKPDLKAVERANEEFVASLGGLVGMPGIAEGLRSVTDGLTQSLTGTLRTSLTKSAERAALAELLGLEGAGAIQDSFLEQFDKRSAVVPMMESIHIAPRERVERFVLPQCLFTPHRIAFKASSTDRTPLRNVDGIVVRDIWVGGASQFVARPGGVHLSAFDGTDLMLDTCMPGQQIGLALENTGSEPVVVEASFHGSPAE